MLLFIVLNLGIYYNKRCDIQ